MKVVVHYYLKLKAHVCFVTKISSILYPAMCCSVKIICNMHYLLNAFVGVISNTALLRRMNNSKTVILNL